MQRARLEAPQPMGLEAIAGPGASGLAAVQIASGLHILNTNAVCHSHMMGPMPHQAWVAYDAYATCTNIIHTSTC